MDRQTDGQTTCCDNTALCVASRDKNTETVIASPYTGKQEMVLRQTRVICLRFVYSF